MATKYKDLKTKMNLQDYRENDFQKKSTKVCLLNKDAIKSLQTNKKLLIIHYSILILMDIYLIYAFIVNLNDGPLLATIHCIQIGIIFISSNLSLIQDYEFWTKLINVFKVLVVITFVNVLVWAIIYFGKSERGNIATDKDGQDFAGYFILMIYLIYLTFIHIKADKLILEEQLSDDSMYNSY